MQKSLRLGLLIFSVVFCGIFFTACNTAPIKSEKNAETSWLRPGLLNSQRIEAKFGSFGVESIAQANPDLRLSKLFSLHGDQKYVRTIALTRYQNPRDESLDMAHSEIVAGGSIGNVLTKHGFKIKKNIFFVDEIGDLPVTVGMLMHTHARHFASIIYDLNVLKDGKVLPYCTILEVYDPDFLSMAEVKQIYRPTKSSSVAEVIAIRPDERAQAMLTTLRLGISSLAK